MKTLSVNMDSALLKRTALIWLLLMIWHSPWVAQILPFLWTLLFIKLTKLMERSIERLESLFASY